NDISDSVFTMTSYIALESPLGGESINGCETLPITWCAGSTSGDYKLEYTEDGGATWNLIVDNHTLAGTNPTYNWVLPNLNSTQFQVKVSDAQFAAKTDQSTDITIGSTQYVQLTNPNGGDSLVSFTVQPVDYLNSGPVTNVNLYYSIDDGISWSTIVTNTSGGTYAWTIPNVDSDFALIKVQDISNACINDISDNYVHLISDIIVMQPDGGENWKSTIRQFPNGVDQDIKIDSDRIEYVYTGQTLYEHGGASTYPGAVVDYTVTLRPAIIDHAVKLSFTELYTYSNHRLYIYDGPTVNDPLLGTYYGSSNPGVKTSTHPSGALTLRWDVNNTYGGYSGYRADLTTIDPYSLAYEDILWDVMGTSGTYHLEYSIDAGASWTRIETDYPSTTGEYKWHVPNDPSTEALVRVIDAGSGLILDQSDNVFTIDQADPKLFYPNGGEDLFSQAPYSIEWEPGLFVESAIRIQYTTDNGNTWNSIVNGTNNDGFYEWTPPIFPQSYPESRIRISEFTSGIFDMSDTLFTLSPAIQIYSPNGGSGNDSLRGCTETTIVFKAGGTTQNYLMEYSADGGSTWTDIESSYFSNSTLTSYDWIIPNLISDNFFVKVSDAGDLTKFDITDFAYNIRQPITIVTPNMSGNLTIGTTYTITWDSDGASNFFDLYYSTDAGATWTTIAINQNITNNEYDWLIPNDASNQVLVRVVDNIDNCKEDVSDNLLNITPGNSPILLITPNGGEDWVACGDSLIAWNAIGTSGAFDIDYSINAGATWINIVSNYVTVTNDYLWSLPSIQENQVVIRVTDATDLSKTDMTDGLFSLIPVVPANITASGATTFCAGGTITLTSSSPTGNLWSPGLETTQSINVSASGTYSVQVTAGGCVATSSPLNVTVNPIPNTPIAGGDSQVAIGATINLTATTIAGALYTWSGPSGFASNQQNPTIPLANFNNSGTYSVSVELNGCSSLANTHDVNVGNTAAISGEVHTEVGVLVPGVNVTATGFSTQNAVTIDDGFYELFLENNEAYSIEPFKNNDVATSNGVTTLDLILMQRHILNVNTLNTPYKLMAADVNFSDDITTLDILLAQSLILQNTSSFPNGRLWSFISSDYTFVDPTDPFPYIESRDYLNIADASSQNFTAMKLGDVNNSWNPLVAKDQDDIEFIVQLGNVSGEMNSTVTIPVYFEYEDVLAGFQMTMDWDPTVMEYVSTNGVFVNPELGKLDMDNGSLPISWYSMDPSGILVEGKRAFEMVFRLKNTPTQSTQLTANSSVIAAEMYSVNLKVLNVGSYGGQVQFTDQDIIEMDVNPNPFNDQLELTFELTSEQNVNVIMINSLGAQISSRQERFEEGSHSLSLNDWLINTSDLANGVYWIRVETESERYIRKIIKL
ncbi:MAG: T9SS type A sorting domain-containing protein, partial [Crocinitomicaceae bacterium]|nr:T9SS type A sorting domain-containing protein [Crocinitomicaceae bacterium]